MEHGCVPLSKEYALMTLAVLERTVQWSTLTRHANDVKSSGKLPGSTDAPCTSSPVTLSVQRAPALGVPFSESHSHGV